MPSQTNGTGCNAPCLGGISDGDIPILKSWKDRLFLLVAGGPKIEHWWRNLNDTTHACYGVFHQKNVHHIHYVVLGLERKGYDKQNLLFLEDEGIQTYKKPEGVFHSNNSNRQNPSSNNDNINSNTIRALTSFFKQFALSDYELAPPVPPTSHTAVCQQASLDQNCQQHQQQRSGSWFGFR